MRKSPRRLHVEKLRDLVIFKVLSEGRIEGIYNYRDLERRARSFEKYPYRFEYDAPRYRIDKDRGEPRPTTYFIRIIGPPGVVLNISWDGDRLQIKKYVPGPWERLL